MIYFYLQQYIPDTKKGLHDFHLETTTMDFKGKLDTKTPKNFVSIFKSHSMNILILQCLTIFAA